ncbi:MULTISPECIES: superoxide dismutase family protein [unclassified Luteimonas]|uniref:superoxide dismutase family protein n=1 Tax=unclassified Luteimonas TaxID=2629088 RepID=UPI0016040DDA|nr:MULTISPECIES: superoxide dismutase family protein [unclassified Luteimonas]MBB1473177.1 superoxide dismutase family protein [Luteimonas sp. MC1782]MBB6598119.1 superoxide dismutase family protein [Luteimonas sp. MC1825]QOC88353.1 superoxide dismutase family protein [Luteimonas sp. MC1825]
MTPPIPFLHPLRAAACALLAAGLLSACASGPPRASTAAPATSAALPRAESGTARQAVANLSAASATLVSGRVALTAEAGGVRLAGEIGGLTPHGAHVLQVHERGDCSAVDASSAGRYFDASGRGVVDGGSDRVVADARGVAQVAQLVPAAVLGGGAANDIAGRALVVMGATSGATGARVACGVIRLPAP